MYSYILSRIKNYLSTHNFLLSLDTVICYLQPQERQSASEMNSEKWNTNTNIKQIQNDVKYKNTNTNTKQILQIGVKYKRR